MAKDKVNQRKIKCPICGVEMVHARFFNESVMGTKHNPYIGWTCQNPNCKGWWCDCCDEWHSYGTSCATALARNARRDNYSGQDPNWRHQEDRVKGRKRKWVDNGDQNTSSQEGR